MDRADEVHVQVLFSTLMEPEAPNTGRAVTSIASDEALGPGPEEGSVGDELQPPDERTTASASVKPWSKRIGLPDYSRDYSGLTISSSAASASVGAQWELPGAVARRDQSHALGFFLNAAPVS